MSIGNIDSVLFMLGSLTTVISFLYAFWMILNVDKEEDSIDKAYTALKHSFVTFIVMALGFGMVFIVALSNVEVMLLWRVYQLCVWIFGLGSVMLVVRVLIFLGHSAKQPIQARMSREER